MDRFSNAVFDSEDSGNEENPEMGRHQTKIIYQNTIPFIHMEPPDLYEHWNSIDPEVRKTAGHMMHISVFWWHILFRQQDNHNTTAWAVAMGFLDSNVSNDISLKRLRKIEILELILDTIEKCLSSTEPEKKAKRLFSIGFAFSMMNQEECLGEVVRLLEDFGHARLKRKLMELGSKKIQFQTLEFVFSEYSRYIQVMCCHKTMMIRELAITTEEWSIQKSEEMKHRGNLEFQKKKYDMALKWYTKAIKYHTNNHFLYGNRALCYIRCEKYLKAVGDGKRAIILQRDWSKGHYRFCDGLFFLGAQDKAMEANIVAQSYCSADSEGMKDLQQQYQRFVFESNSKGKASVTLEVEKKLKKMEAKKGINKQTESAYGIDPLPFSSEGAHTSSTAEDEKTTEETKMMQEPSGNSTTEPYAEGILKVPKHNKSEMRDRNNKKTTPNPSEKQSTRSKHAPAQDKPQSSATNGEAGSKEQFCTAVQDAHTALTDQRCRNAEQAFSLALRILNSSGPISLGISDLDKALLVYGYATALIEIGHPEELAEASLQLTELRSSADRTFQSLVHYGLGRVFLKENRFGDAHQEFSNALLMVQRQIMPGKLTWPTTKVTVQETQPEFLKDQLKSFIERCKFPPRPDALCRHQHSRNQVAEIYFTDPDFKGFIRLSCCQSCKVEFHIGCWKKYKAALFADKNDKDFLQDKCFTPDCTGTVCHIEIFDSTGLVKCEFKSPISRKKESQRPRVKQECTSHKKLNSKADRKLRRKQNRAAVSVKDERNGLSVENEPSKDEKAITQSPRKDSVIYGDRVLHQIYESRELFNDEICSISTILVCLKPWMELDKAMDSISLLSCHTEPKRLRDLVDVLLERKNRVWARIFIHNLSGCIDIKPKLHEWAQQLDSAGLKTAEQFIAQCSDHLEDLELSSLLKFPPLQDLNEKFGTMQLPLGDTDFTITDYLRQAPSQEMRLFIWSLEEHKDCYPSFLTLLDEYFEMDAICFIIKKTEIDDDMSSINKCKSKHRKKKQKEPKSILVLTGLRGGASRDDEDDFFTEEDSLMLLDSADPFSVPDHLREQIAEFEGQYDGTGRTSHYNRFLDNNPDPATENLYDYFAQILVEHGPLELSDPRLVSELEYFPSEAKQKIEVAGGLESFLCSSLRFVKLNDLIGLITQSVCLQQTLDNYGPTFFDGNYTSYNNEDSESTGSSYLNPTAKEFLPHTNHFSSSDDTAFNNNAVGFNDNSITGTGPTLPNPYDLISQNYGLVSQDINRTVEPELEGAVCLIYPFTPETFGLDCNDVSSCEGLGHKESPKCKAISVQTFTDDNRDDVVINTEPFAPFEKNGSITQMEKDYGKMQKHIQGLTETLEVLQKQRVETCSVTEAELKNIQVEMEVASKELTLFQDKLEDEVRTGQQEKRDQQEMVKALKVENKELTDLLESCSKQIQDNDAKYQKELNHFLAVSNQAEAEKMSLDEEIKRYRDLLDKATRRSLAAQVTILQNKKEQELRGLKKYISNGKDILQTMAEVSTRYQSEELFSAIKTWKAFVQDVEEKYSRTEMQYKEQIELVKNGSSLSSLPSVSLPSIHAPPPVPAFLYQSSIQQPLAHQLPVRRTQPHAPYGVQQNHVWPQAHTTVNTTLAQPTQRATHTPPLAYEGAVSAATTVTPTLVQPNPHAMFERIIDRLSSMFPLYSRTVLSRFIQEVRAINSGTLNKLTYEDVINRAVQLILDHQEHLQVQNLESGDMFGVRERPVSSPTPPVDFSNTTASPPPAWKNVSSEKRSSSRALNMEDPCIICHDDMAPEDMCVLECRHSFHKECIQSWLKEQSTCPTCREHALLPEDFPMLPGRQRRGHAAASSNS